MGDTDPLSASLRSKRFQSSYCAKVRAGAKQEKGWVPSFPSPSPVIPSFFCSRPNFLDELARKRLLRRLVICVTFRLPGAGYSAGSCAVSLRSRRLEVAGERENAGYCAVYSVYWPRRSHGSGHGPADSLSWLSTTKKPLGCQNPAHKSNQLVNSSWQLSGSYPRHPDLYHE